MNDVNHCAYLCETNERKLFWIILVYLELCIF